LVNHSAQQTVALILSLQVIRFLKIN